MYHARVWRTLEKLMASRPGTITPRKPCKGNACNYARVWRTLEKSMTSRPGILDWANASLSDTLSIRITRDAPRT